MYPLPHGAKSITRGKIVSKAISTTTNADGTRNVRTVTLYSDGTRSITSDTLPPHGVEQKLPPDEAPRDDVSKNNVPFDEESLRGLRFVSASSRSAEPGPVNMVYMDQDEDLSVMDSVLEHPVTRYETPPPATMSALQPPPYTQAPPVSITAMDVESRSAALDDVGSVAPNSGARASNVDADAITAGCDRHKWIIFAFLIFVFAVVGVALCVYIAYHAFTSKTVESTTSQQLDYQRPPMDPGSTASSSSIIQTSPIPSAEPSASPTTPLETDLPVVRSFQPWMIPTPTPSTQTPSRDPTSSASSNPTPQPSQAPSSILSITPTSVASSNPTPQVSQVPSSMASTTPSPVASSNPTPQSTSITPTSDASLSPSSTLSPITSTPVVSTSPSSTLSPITPTPVASTSPTTMSPVTLTPTVSIDPSVSTSLAPESSSPISPSAGTPVSPSTDSPETTCSNTIGWVDSNDASCQYYEINGCFLSSLKENNAGVTAWRSCCVCGGGNQNFVDGDPNSCQDYLGFVDNSGNTCTWYAQNNACDEAALALNAAGASALEACCYCDGGSSR